MSNNNSQAKNDEQEEYDENDVYVDNQEQIFSVQSEIASKIMKKNLHIDKLTGYGYLNQDQILERVNFKMNQIQELGIENDFSLLLLTHFNFNGDQILEHYFSNEERAKIDRILGLDQWKEKTKVDIKDNINCMICFSENTPENPILIKAPCKCIYCRECCKEHVIKYLKQLKGLIPCMNCQAPIPNSLVQQLLRSELEKNLYNRAIANQYVLQNDIVKWCPYPGCEFAIENTKYKPYMICKCGNQFCSNKQCELEQHLPCNCNQMIIWNQRFKKGDLDSIWINSNTRTCPHCKFRFTQGDGCKHLTCYSTVGGCGGEFCEICQKPWRTENHNSCNQFIPQKLSSQEEAILQRIEFYTKQYAGYTRTQKAILENRANLDQMITKIKKFLKFDDSHFVVFNHAYTTLIDVNRLLKNSYVFGFKLAESNPPVPQAKAKFQFFQGEFEFFVQDLYSQLQTQLAQEITNIIDQKEQEFLKQKLELNSKQCFELDCNNAKELSQVFQDISKRVKILSDVVVQKGDILVEIIENGNVYK